MNLNDLHQKFTESKDYIDASNELKLHFDLANSILRARIKKGLSQQELAERIGTKQANISKIEAGLANPTLSVIQRLSKVLDINISFSCDETHEFVFPTSLNFDKTVSKEISKDWYTIVIESPKYEVKTDKKMFSEVYEFA